MARLPDPTCPGEPGGTSAKEAKAVLKPHLLNLSNDVPSELRPALCAMFYDRVYRDAFPKADLAETPEVWLPLMGAAPQPPRPSLHIILALRQRLPATEISETDILGGAILECFHQSGATLLTYICVHPSAGGQGVARSLVARVRSEAEQHARGEPLLLLAETEKPSSSLSEEDKGAVRRRIVQLDALGFQRIDVGYRQPPLRPGQAPSDDLVLMAHAPEGEELISPRRLRRFLDEFSASLAEHRGGAELDLAPGLPIRGESQRGEGAWLRTTALTSLLPWEDRPQLGSASSICLRFTFICEPIRFDVRSHASRLDPRPVTLSSIAQDAEVMEDVRDFLEPMRSFSTDITISEEGTRRLPLAALCELPASAQHGEHRLVQPQDNRITIELPQSIVTDWENENVSTSLGPDSDECINITARCIDTISIFATNQIAYSISFLLDEEDLGSRPVLDAARFLTLLSLAGSAGAPSGQRWQALSRKIAFIHAGQRYQLHQLASARLRAMCLLNIADAGERAELEKAWAEDDLKRGVGRTPHWTLPPGTREIFSTLLRRLAVRFSGSEHAETMRKVRTALCSPRPEDMQGASLEVVGFSAFQRARATIEAARKRQAPLSEFTRMLSGLAQAVIDFDDQDLHEVNDSLMTSDITGDYIHFVHRHTVIRLSKNSRSFDRMKHWIGGCPYFYLSTVSAAFNERLVRDANKAIAKLRPAGATVGFSLPLNGKHHEAQARRIEERFHFFESFEADMVPDVFRYPSESELFRMIEQQRGTALQRQEGRRLLSQIENFERERSTQSREWVEALLTAAVFTLTVWQVFGVIWDSGGKQGDQDLKRLLGWSAPPLETYVFPSVGVPILLSTILLTLFFLVSWLPSALRSRYRAKLNLMPTFLLVLFVVLLPLMLFVWKFLALA